MLKAFSLFTHGRLPFTRRTKNIRLNMPERQFGSTNKKSTYIVASASLSEESRLRQMIATLNVQYLEDNLSMTCQKSISIITNRRAQYLHYTIYSIVTNFFSLMNDFQQGSWFIVVFIPLLSRYINKELKEKTKIGQNIKYPESLHVDFVPNLTHLNSFFFFLH